MNRFVRVIVDQSTGRLLDYRVPESVSETIVPGARVRVPLRTRLIMATVVEILNETDAQGVRDVAAVLDGQALIRPTLMELARWMADYYCCPLEVALRSVLPQVVRDGEVRHKMVRLWSLTRPVDEASLTTLSRRAQKQADVLRWMAEQNRPVAATEIQQALGLGTSVLHPLEKKGWVVSEETKANRDPYAGEVFLESKELPLTAEQTAVFAQVEKALAHPAAAKPLLLHGVTGSGKTEIYLRAIRQVIDRGHQAIVLVPEIALTPQTVERFKSRFAATQNQVAVMHSHLSDGERYDEWRRIHEGQASIVIGARSAVFAPLDRLGLIVVDEEHESSYKQEEAPRYNARDLAVLRAHREQCVVLLGSATPSLESFHNATQGKYELLNLLSRVDDKKMPLIRVIDMRMRKGKGADQVLSPVLTRAMELRLSKGEQTILFLNRRGFSTSLLCTACGHVCECPNCSVALTFHRGAGRLICHICGHQALAPRQCPACRDEKILHSGSGTEKVEDAVRKFFPQARLARMDADSMTRKEAYRETLGRFKAGQIDILVGTQMIAKGLHFPNVTLVGIINADMGLHLPDFRAGERTFQLLTQVAGRAGRGEVEGEVLVQTHTPASPAIQFARHHDFAGFWEQEREFRSAFHYPPFSRMVLITLKARQRDLVELAANNLARQLHALGSPSALIGEASPAPLEKAKGLYRFQISLRGKSASSLSRTVGEALRITKIPRSVHVAVDVDPLHLL